MLHKSIVKKFVSLFALLIILLTPLLAAGCAGLQGIQGLQGEQGEPGISLTWRGSLAAAPASPQLNDAYYNTVNAKSYVWDGDSWETLAQDGAHGPQGTQGIQGIQGIQGLQGIQGERGISITWRGSLATAPVSPQLNDAYYNTADAKSYIWDGDSWETLAQDGAQGPQGIQGVQGEQGEQGIQGIQGEQGYGFAALVVAAADSLDQDADYVCNGTDDQVEINAAINALPANGGSVYLREGTYIVSTSIIISKSNVALIGTGPSTVIKIKNGKNADIDVIYALDKSNLLVKNLRIDGNKTNQATGLMYGIIFSGVEYSKIVDCWAGNLRMYAIGLISSNYNTVSGNTCQGNGNNGIYVSESSDNTVTGNTSQDNSYYGINLHFANNTIVSGNTCHYNGQYGIWLISSSNNTISGNTVQGNSLLTHNIYSGIFVSGNSDYNNIQGNTVRKGTETNQQKYGIRIESGLCEYNLVANNDCYYGGVDGGISNSGLNTSFGAGNRNNDGSWSTTPN